MTRHFVLPDVQVRPGDDFKFLTAIGRYILKMQPDVLIQIGDWADMPSLSSYDIGKKSFEGRRYQHDIKAARDAMDALFLPIWEYNERQRKNGKKQYRPEMHLTLGNHEQRIVRAVDGDPKLDGTLSIDDLGYSNYGWKVHTFLDVVVIDGVAYSHYFVTGTAGRPSSTAAAQSRKANMSSIAGHQQGLQIHTFPRADGALLTSVIAGSCYEHAEAYLGPQGNRHWRGVLVLHEVHDGQFDLMPVSLDFITRKYGS